MPDLYTEMTLINIHAVSAARGTTLLVFPLFYLTLYVNSIILHLEV